MEYRREIDGLRAVAVVPVILFHAGYDFVSGGFVGVDVFFVISGYLITTIILAEKEKGSFSLISFYERRARRILPSLFAIMLISIFFGWFLLLPDAYKDFSQSLVAVSIFSSNIHFLIESDYFAAAAEMKPLLHTWSLAVEEQYYLIFPLFLISMWRFRKRWIFSSLIIIGVLSLSLAQWGAYNAPAFSFFLLPTRAWELMVGALVAFYLLYGKKEIAPMSGRKIGSEWGGLFGLILIAITVFTFDESTPFPSVFAIIPTAGTALIILFAYENTIVGRVLGSKFLVKIGLISYSLYLWHQPIFSFYRYRSMTTPSYYEYFILIILAVILAHLTWRYIEKPFRNKTKISRQQIFYFTVIGSILFIGIGLVGHIYEGLSSRFPKSLSSYISGAEDVNPNRKLCKLSNFNDYFDFSSSCSIGDSSNIRGVLFGDSHSDAMAYSLGERLQENGLGLKHLWYGGCPPILNLYAVDSKRDSKCVEHNEYIYNIISKNKDIDNIVLLARFTIYIEGEGFDNNEGGKELGLVYRADGPEYKGKVRTEEDRKNLVMARYVDSVRALLELGKNVILVYPIPEVGWIVPTHAAKSLLYYGAGDVSTSYELYLDRNARTIASFDSIGDYKNLERVYPHKILCDTYVEQRCIATLNGHSLYYDDDHLSNYGAQLVVGEIVSKLK